MASAALRRAVFGLACVWLAASAAAATVERINGADYVSMVDVCERLGLRFALSTDARTMTVRSASHAAVISSRHPLEREMTLDGVKVYLGDPAVSRAGFFYISRIDYEHRLLPLFRPDLAGPAPRRPHVIVIDPGHGGIDPGTESRRFHLKEKDVALDVSLRLRSLLQRDGWTVFLTRERDTELSRNKAADLELRAYFAAQHKADLLLSIHFDAAPNSNVRGSEVLSFCPRGQRSTDSWGMGQNDRLPEFEPANRNDAWNAVLAHSLFRVLPHALGTYDHGERIRHLAILRVAACPAVMVEPAFLSNEAEAQRVASPDFRQRIAVALETGLRDYVTLLGSLQPRPPPPRPQGSRR